jgi:hypothetical protein
MFIACGVTTHIVAMHKANTHVNFDNSNKHFQASPARNKTFLNRQKKQIDEQLLEHNKIVEQNYAKKAAWKAKYGNK